MKNGLGLSITSSNILGSIIPTPPATVDSITMLGYVHSLWDHDTGVNGDHVDQEVGNWLHRMTTHDGKTFVMENDFGQHNTYQIPMVGPIPTSEETGFTSTTWPGIDAANVSHIIFTPDNYNRGSDAPANKPNNIDATRSNLEAVLEITDAYITNVGETPKVRIYNSWPKCDPLNSTGFAVFLTDCFKTYRSWGHQLVADIKAARPSWDVELLDTAEVLSDVMNNTAASALTETDWFEDIGPHGTAETYLIAAAILYRMLYGAVPTDYTVPVQIHDSIENNWAAIAGYINTRVNTMNVDPYPGHIAVSSETDTGVKATTAATGYGIDVEIKAIGAPVATTDIEYSNDSGTTWRSTGLSGAGTVNLPFASDGDAFLASTSEDVQFRAVNAQGNGTASRDVTVTTGANQAPLNTVAASITGAGYGVEQTCNLGTWTGTATITYAYQWLLDGADISGETSSTYTPLVGQVGQTLSCEVTASNGVTTIVETAGVVVAAPSTEVTMAGTQSIHGFTADTSVTSFTVLFSGITYSAYPASNEYFLGINDATTGNILIAIGTTGRTRATVAQDSGFSQSAFAEKVPLDTPFDLRIEFDTAGGIESTYTFAVYVDDVRWVEYSASTTAQDLSDIYLFADNLNAQRPSCTIEGVTVTIDGAEALDLNPGSATLFNSDSDNDARSFTHTGTFT